MELKQVKGLFLMTVAFVAISSCKGGGGYSAVRLSINETFVAASEGVVKVAVSSDGHWSLSLVSDVEEVSWASLSKKEGNHDAVVEISVKPNPDSQMRSCTVELTSGSKTYRKSFLQDGLAPVPRWMELPIVKDDAVRTFYSHDMSISGRKVRNYSFLLNRTARVSEWVAYPLNRGLIGGGDRLDAWGVPDPKAPASDYPNVSRSFSGYDRGHQVPSADRYAANESTYYGTNITPQKASFNQGIWESLESMVRGWSNSFDTLYVVTGADVRGSKTTVSDASGKKITVPVGYYKVVLGYKHNGNIGITSKTNGYSGVAFYLEHTLNPAESEYYNTIMSRKMTIDEIEDLLEIDFFPNLILKTEKASQVESTSDAWWK